jgi:hypothetical protein
LFRTEKVKCCLLTQKNTLDRKYYEHKNQNAALFITIPIPLPSKEYIVNPVFILSEKKALTLNS